LPPHRTAVLSDAAAIAPTQRDRHLKCIAEKGAAWPGRKPLVTVDAQKLRRQLADEASDRRQPAFAYTRRRATEVEVAVHVLNRMSALGRPTMSASSDATAGLGSLRDIGVVACIPLIAAPRWLTTYGQQVAALIATTPQRDVRPFGQRPPESPAFPAPAPTPFDSTIFSNKVVLS
jgi:hypothetical protein